MSPLFRRAILALAAVLAQPDYRAIREADTEIVPLPEAQKIWMSKFIERLRTADRALKISVDLTRASEESLETICKLLVRSKKQ